MKLDGQFWRVTNLCDFGEDPEMRIFGGLNFRFFIIERWGQKRYTTYIVRCFKTLTDYDKMWWVIWLGNNKAMSFSCLGPDADPANRWDTKCKLFSLAEEVCAPPSAVLV